MSRDNGHERRREDNADERACPVNPNGNTLAKALPAGRLGAIGNGLLIERMTIYAAFPAC